MAIEEEKKTSQAERIQKILDEYQHLNLFAEIKDPSEWQREIRKEWDRDFNDIIPPSGGQGA